MFTIMPPSTTNSLSGSRSRRNEAPSVRPSNGAGSIDRPPSGGAFDVRVVVGRIGPCDSFTLRVPVEIFEHRRTRFRGSKLHLVARPVADDSVEIELRLLDRVFVPEAALCELFGIQTAPPETAVDPPTTGVFSTISACEAFDRGGQRGAHPSRSRADAHHVGFVVPPHCWLVGAHSAAPRRE